MFSTIFVFLMERPLFLRKVGNKSYTALPYFVSKSIVELPSQIIFPAFYAILLYYPLGLDPAFGSFLFYVFTVIILGFTGASWGIFIGCVFWDFTAANAITGAVLNIPVLFNGFYANI